MNFLVSTQLLRGSQTYFNEVCLLWYQEQERQIVTAIVIFSANCTILDPQKLTYQKYLCIPLNSTSDNMAHT